MKKFYFVNAIVYKILAGVLRHLFAGANHITI